MKTTDELALVHQQNQSVAKDPLKDGFDIEGVFRYAIEHQGTAETLEKLMAIRRELNAEQSKKAFDDALSAFQSECPVIMKERPGAITSGKAAYHYASIENIEVQIRPLLRKHGFSHTFDTDTASSQGWVIAKCIVTHVGGHSRVSTAKFPLGTKTALMSETQVYAAALTFANRRVLSNAYGLILAGEDMDGATGKMKPRGPSSKAPADIKLKDLARELWETLQSVRGNQQNWLAANQWMWREEILDGAIPEEAPNLTEERFKKAIALSKERLAR